MNRYVETSFTYEAQAQAAITVAGDKDTDSMSQALLINTAQVLATLAVQHATLAVAEELRQLKDIKSA